jgi:hypothetical protein
VDFPARLIQDRVVAWRDLGVLAKVVEARYGVAVTSDELRTVAPATISAMLAHLSAKHGVARADGDEGQLAIAVAERLLGELDGIGMDFSDLKTDVLAGYLLENLHSPAAMDEVMNRFTVRALTTYVAAQLEKAARLASA